eukprot:IDg20594t1
MLHWDINILKVTNSSKKENRSMEEDCAPCSIVCRVQCAVETINRNCEEYHLNWSAVTHDELKMFAYNQLDFQGAWCARSHCPSSPRRPTIT